MPFCCKIVRAFHNELSLINKTSQTDYKFSIPIAIIGEKNSAISLYDCLSGSLIRRKELENEDYIVDLAIFEMISHSIENSTD